MVSETHLVLTNTEDYQGREKFFEEEYEIVLEYTLDEKKYQNEKNGWSLLWLLKTEMHRK